MAVAINRTGPGSEEMLVTPEMAKEWLRANETNRRKRPQAIEDDARDIITGNWAYNGETVKFSWDGFLLDGQHRLEAIVLAGKTNPAVLVKTLVVFGLDPESQKTMDRGIKRTAADMYGMSGHKNSPVLAAVIKKMWAWEEGDHKFSGKKSPTMAEYDEILRSHPEIFRAVEVAAQVRSHFKIAPQSVTGIAYCLLLEQNPEKVPEFFARLGDGANLDLDHPVLKLRSRFLRDSQDRGRQTAPWIQLAYIIRAWNAYVEDRTLGNIVQDASLDMPMPRAGKKPMANMSIEVLVEETV